MATHWPEVQSRRTRTKTARSPRDPSALPRLRGFHFRSNCVPHGPQTPGGAQSHPLWVLQCETATPAALRNPPTATGCQLLASVARLQQGWGGRWAPRLAHPHAWPVWVCRLRSRHHPFDSRRPSKRRCGRTPTVCPCPSGHVTASWRAMRSLPGTPCNNTTCHRSARQPRKRGMRSSHELGRGEPKRFAAGCKLHATEIVQLLLAGKGHGHTESQQSFHKSLPKCCDSSRHSPTRGYAHSLAGRATCRCC